MEGHFVALVPGHRAPELCWQRLDPGGHGSTDLVGSPVAEFEQHDEPGLALDQGADGARFGADNEIALPVAWDGSVLDFCGSLRDQHHLWDPASALDGAAGLGSAYRPAAAKGLVELGSKGASALHVEGLVDGLVRHAQFGFHGMVPSQPLRDLAR